MSPIRIFVMQPLREGGPWHVSVNGSEGESFDEEKQAVIAACDMGRRLAGAGHDVEVRQETSPGSWTKVLP